jgi:hypothetical protein
MIEVNLELTSETTEEEMDWQAWYGMLDKNQRSKLAKINERLTYACRVLGMDFVEALDWVRRE